MRNRTVMLAVVLMTLSVLISLAGSVGAQQFSSGPNAPKAGSVFSTTSTPSFFSQTMARPNMSAMMNRPTVPAPLNLFNLIPSFSGLQNTMLLRNVIGQQSAYSLPKQATPPPKKK